MQTFFAYHFLQALAFSLLNSLWQMAFLWIVYSLFKSLLQLNAQKSYRGLVLIQLTGFCWFFYTFITAFTLPQISSYINFSELNQPFIAEKLLPVIGVVYLFFVLVFGAKFLIQFTSLKDLRNNETNDISTKWKTFVAETSNRLNIKKDVAIKISKSITTPLTIGFIKPIILIPIASINNLTAAQLEAVLLHELAHIKRQDYIINLLLMMIDVLMFFNPFSKCISKQIDIERELCCDDMVLHQNCSSTIYAEALLTIAKSQLQVQPVFGALTAVASNNQLKDRIKKILSIEVENKNVFWLNKQMLFPLFFGVMLFFLIGFINTNVKRIVSENIGDANSDISFINTTTKTNSQSSIIENKIDKTVKVKAKKNTTKVITDNNETVLIENRKTLEKGFQFIGKLATEDKNRNVLTAYNSEEELLNNSETTNDEVTVNATIDKHPTTTIQRFFVPATTKSASSFIVITTTEKEDGKKVVKIEIVKGDSKVE